MPEWGKTEFDTFYSLLGERWGHPNTRPGIRLHYHWASIIGPQSGVSVNGLVSPNFPQMLFDVLGLVAGDAVLLVGCGFNGTGAGLTALGIRVLGTDLSTYIQTEKGNTEQAEIEAACVAAGVNPDTDLIRGPAGDINPLDLFLEGGRAAPAARGKGEILEEELRTRGSRNAVLNRFDALWPGVTPRYIITEEVLNSITDAEASLVCDYVSAGRAEWGATVVHMLSPLQPGGSQAPELNWKTYQGWRDWLTINGYAAHLILPTVTAVGQGMTFPADNGVSGRVVAYSGIF